MRIALPNPDQLPRTADHYEWHGKPVAIIPGRCGIAYEPGPCAISPRAISWTQVIKQGRRISAEQFRALVSRLTD